MPIIWTLKYFLGCIHDPQSKNFAFISEEFWIRDILDVTSIDVFGVQKSCTSCPNRGRGGRGGNLDKIQKSSYIFRETFPKSFSRESDLILTIRLHGILSFCRCKRSNRCRVGHSVFCPSAIFLDSHIQLLKLLRFLQFQNRESKKEFYNLICIFWMFRLSSIKVT